MADYGDAYAWADGGSTGLHHYFPELPEVKRIEDEMLWWSGELWKTHSHDPNFPWEDYYRRGLALAQQFSEALPAEYDIEISFSRPTEDPAWHPDQKNLILRYRKDAPESIQAHRLVGQVKNHPGLVVLRESVDSTSQQFWLLDMTPDEFENWWRSQESFYLPTHEIDFILAREFGEPPPAHRPPMRLPGVFIDADNYHETAILWTTLHDSHQHYFCNLCCNDDSVLCSPDGRIILHKGDV